MTDTCDHCDDTFATEKERLEHELDEHGSELSSHAKSEKKEALKEITRQEEAKKQARKQKLKYGGIAVLVALVVVGGGFIAAQTLDFSTTTANQRTGVGQTIHWHAPFEISVCGETKIPQGGPMLAHTHGEQVFHLEGRRTRDEQARLGWVMDQLGANITNSSVYGKSSCNGEPADLTVTANGDEIENPPGYVIQDSDTITIQLS